MVFDTTCQLKLLPNSGSRSLASSSDTNITRLAFLKASCRSGTCQELMPSFPNCLRCNSGAKCSVTTYGILCFRLTSIAAYPAHAQQWACRMSGLPYFFIYSSAISPTMLHHLSTLCFMQKGMARISLRVTCMPSILTSYEWVWLCNHKLGDRRALTLRLAIILTVCPCLTKALLCSRQNKPPYGGKKDGISSMCIALLYIICKAYLMVSNMRSKAWRNASRFTMVLRICRRYSSLGEFGNHSFIYPLLEYLCSIWSRNRSQCSSLFFSG